MRAYLITAAAAWLRRWGSAMFVAVLLVALAGGSLEWTAYSVNSSNHKWCETLQLLTARPPVRPSSPPQVNTAQWEEWRLYQDFLTLRNRLGCLCAGLPPGRG